MSKLESPITERFWEKHIGGTFIPEYQLVKSTDSSGRRLADAIILPDEDRKRGHWREYPLKGQRVVVVQTKATRIGMSLMGQTIFSKELVKKLGAKTVRSIALCTANCQADKWT